MHYSSGENTPRYAVAMKTEDPPRSRRRSAHALLLAGWGMIFLAISISAGLWRTGSNAINPINAAIITGELLIGFMIIVLLTSAAVALRRAPSVRWVVAVHGFVAAAIACVAVALLVFARQWQRDAMSLELARASARISFRSALFFYSLVSFSHRKHLD